MSSSPKHYSVRVPRAYDDQSFHAQSTSPFVFQEHTATRANIQKTTFPRVVQEHTVRRASMPKASFRPCCSKKSMKRHSEQFKQVSHVKNQFTKKTKRHIYGTQTLERAWRWMQRFEGTGWKNRGEVGATQLCCTSVSTLSGGIATLRSSCSTGLG